MSKCSGMEIEMRKTNLYKLPIADDQIILGYDEGDINHLVRKLLEELI